jgi:hypothetical protein
VKIFGGLFYFWRLVVIAEVIMNNRSCNSFFTRFLLVFILFAFTFWMASATVEAKIVEGMQVDNTQPAVLDRENPQIQAVMAIQDHYWPTLRALPDVVGTATGLTDQGNPAILVFTKGPGAVGIPARLEGVPVVVKITGEFHALKPNKGGGGTGKGGTSVSTTAILTPPVPIGVSTGNRGECSAGTIAARVIDGKGNYYALSNNHVYALENKAAPGSEVLQPGLYDTQCSPSGNVIGELAYYIPIDFSSKGNNTVDAALAIMGADSKGGPMVDNSTPSNGYGTPSSTTAMPAVGTSVEKYGRTTQLTVGTITAINATITINYGTSGNATFTNQFIVQSGKPFVKAGDSGSLIVTTSGLHPVGLLFAGDSSGKYGIANDINNVISAFGRNFKIDGK